MVHDPRTNHDSHNLASNVRSRFIRIQPHRLWVLPTWRGSRNQDEGVVYLAVDDCGYCLYLDYCCEYVHWVLICLKNWADLGNLFSTSLATSLAPSCLAILIVLLSPHSLPPPALVLPRLDPTLSSSALLQLLHLRLLWPCSHLPSGPINLI
jgi:hypothetical protein